MYVQRTLLYRTSFASPLTGYFANPRIDQFPISIDPNLAQHNRPQHEALGQRLAFIIIYASTITCLVDLESVPN